MRSHINFLKPIMLALAIIMASPAFAEEALKSAPELDLPTAQARFKLSDYKGKLVYLDFWASWCGPCKQSFPWMNAMHEKYQQQGLEVVAINLDANAADAQAFLANVPAKFKVAFDSKGESPRLFGVKGMPTSYLLDRNGKIVFQHMGFNASEKDKLEEKIKQYLEAK